MSLAAIQLSAELLRNPDTTGSEDEDDPEAAAAYNRQQEFLAKGASSVQALSQKYEDSSRWERAEDFSTKKQETYIDLNNGHLMVEDEKGNFIDKNQEAEDSGNLEKAKEIEQRVAELLSGAARDLSLNTVYTDAEKAKRNYGIETRLISIHINPDL